MYKNNFISLFLAFGTLIIGVGIIAKYIENHIEIQSKMLSKEFLKGALMSEFAKENRGEKNDNS